MTKSYCATLSHDITLWKQQRSAGRFAVKSRCGNASQPEPLSSSQWQMPKVNPIVEKKYTDLKTMEAQHGSMVAIFLRHHFEIFHPFHPFIPFKDTQISQVFMAVDASFGTWDRRTYGGGSRATNRDTRLGRQGNGLLNGWEWMGMDGLCAIYCQGMSNMTNVHQLWKVSGVKPFLMCQSKLLGDWKESRLASTCCRDVQAMPQERSYGLGPWRWTAAVDLEFGEAQIILWYCVDLVWKFLDVLRMIDGM